LEQNARAILGEPGTGQRVARTAAMRYVLQEWELRVPVPDGPLDVEQLASAFHDAHRRRYGFAREDRPTELVTLYVDVVLPAPALAYGRPDQGEGDSHRGRRRIYVDGEQGTVELPVYERAQLRTGDRVAGPSVVEEPTSTTYLAPGWTAEVDAIGNL